MTDNLTEDEQRILDWLLRLDQDDELPVRSIVAAILRGEHRA